MSVVSGSRKAAVPFQLGKNECHLAEDVSSGVFDKTQTVVEMSDLCAQSNQPLQKKATHWDCSSCKGKLPNE